MDQNGVSGGTFLEGGGELGAMMRAHDWTTTPLGPPGAWPLSLKTAVRIMLTGWGQEQDRSRAREAGFDHHLTRPADLTALHSLLASL